MPSSHDAGERSCACAADGVQLFDDEAGDALGGAAVEEPALLQRDPAPSFAIERRAVEIASYRIDELRGCPGDAHRAMTRHVHVMGETIVPARRSRPFRRRL